MGNFQKLWNGTEGIFHPLQKNVTKITFFKVLLYKIGDLRDLDTNTVQRLLNTSNEIHGRFHAKGPRKKVNVEK